MSEIPREDYGTSIDRSELISRMNEYGFLIKPEEIEGLDDNQLNQFLRHNYSEMTHITYDGSSEGYIINWLAGRDNEV